VAWGIGVAAVVLIQSSFFGHVPALASSAITESETFGAANSAAATSLSASPTSATTAGNTLVATIRLRNTTALPSVTKVADSKGETWRRAAAVASGAQTDGEIWYFANAASIPTTGSVTVTASAASAIGFTVLDLSGASATPLDKTATNAGTGTAASTGTTAVTSQANEIAVADVGWNGTPTPSGQTSGYTTTSVEQATVSGTAMGEQAAWKLLGTTGAQSYAATLSASSAWTGAIATFETSSTSTPTPSPTGSTPTPKPTATPTPTPTGTPPPHPPHIMIIVDENKAYSKAQGSPYIIGNTTSAPYINSLVSKYRSATHWFANQHGSPDDYLDLISGSNQGLGAGTKPPYTATSLVDELKTAGISWKAYMEAMPSACYNGGTTGLYESDHNPFVYFSDYKSLCSGSNGVVPYTVSGMSTALNSSSPPDFVWITPNICDDMHTNGGSCGSNGVADGDTWLKDNLPTVLSSSWFADNGVVIITWDESLTKDTSGGSYGDGGQIPALVIAANAHGAFTASGDHYATLRGIEEAYGVGLLGGSANSAYGDLGPAF
jgi:acid phosphatase